MLLGGYKMMVTKQQIMPLIVAANKDGIMEPTLAANKI